MPRSQYRPAPPSLSNFPNADALPFINPAPLNNFVGGKPINLTAPQMPAINDAFNFGEEAQVPMPTLNQGLLETPQIAPFEDYSSPSINPNNGGGPKDRSDMFLLPFPAEQEPRKRMAEEAKPQPKVWDK